MQTEQLSKRMCGTQATQAAIDGNLDLEKSLFLTDDSVKKALAIKQLKAQMNIQSNECH